jgi:hypothetical protein
MLELLSENWFQFKGDSNLDLWPCDPKFNRGLLPNMDNHPMKFEYWGAKWNLSYVPETIFSFTVIVTLTLWPQNQKGSSTQYGQSSNEVWILLAKWNLSYAPETIFSVRAIVTLTFDLVTPKSIGVFYPIWTIILWSLKTVGQMELKLCFRTQIRKEGRTFPLIFLPIFSHTRLTKRHTSKNGMNRIKEN